MPDEHKRRRRGMWAWGIAWALALVSVFYMWSVFDSDGQPGDEPRAVDATAAGSRDLRRVDAYRAFVTSPGVRPGPSHEYTARGIEHLADAIRAIADAYPAGSGSLTEQLKTFQQSADQLRANPTSLDHADVVRAVFNAAVDAIAYLQRTGRPESAGLDAKISKLRQLAGDLKASEPLLRQQERVQEFFAGAAEVLHAMANG